MIMAGNGRYEKYDYDFYIENYIIIITIKFSVKTSNSCNFIAIILVNIFYSNV